MKKKVLSVLFVAAMTMSMLTGCGSSNNAGTAATGEAQNSAAASTTTEQASTATDAGTTLIALITMDSLDQHWVTLNEGAQKAAENAASAAQASAESASKAAAEAHEGYPYLRPWELAPPALECFGDGLSQQSFL